MYNVIISMAIAATNVIVRGCFWAVIILGQLPNLGARSSTAHEAWNAYEGYHILVDEVDTTRIIYTVCCGL